MGVAYGSEVALVERLLIEAMSTQSEIARHPEPVVYFQEFRDSSLDFTVVRWLQDPWSRMAVSSRVRAAIDARFREHGVEIPFPQRDVHLRGGGASLPA